MLGTDMRFELVVALLSEVRLHLGTADPKKTSEGTVSIATMQIPVLCHAVVHIPHETGCGRYPLHGPDGLGGAIRGTGRGRDPLHGPDGLGGAIRGTRGQRQRRPPADLDRASWPQPGERHAGVARLASQGPREPGWPGDTL